MQDALSMKYFCPCFKRIHNFNCFHLYYLNRDCLLWLWCFVRDYLLRYYLMSYLNSMNFMSLMNLTKAQNFVYFLHFLTVLTLFKFKFIIITVFLGLPISLIYDEHSQSFIFQETIFFLWELFLDQTIELASPSANCLNFTIHLFFP